MTIEQEAPVRLIDFGVFRQYFADEAGRVAFLAGFHAPRAVPFEKNGGSRSYPFDRRIEGEAEVDRDIWAILTLTENITLLCPGCILVLLLSLFRYTR